MTVFSDLHKKLRIPADYHRTNVCSYQPKRAPELSKDDRNAALAKLQDAGVIEGTTQDDLLAAIARRMWPLVELPQRSKGRPPTEATKNGYLEHVAARKQRIINGILANPDVETVALAERLGVNRKTIQNYRGILKREGRI